MKPTNSKTNVNSNLDGEILDWLEAHAISVRIQQNERQAFVIPATREAIRFEMTAGNVDKPNVRGEVPRSVGTQDAKQKEGK